jgi:hypothetical protein
MVPGSAPRCDEPRSTRATMVVVFPAPATATTTAGPPAWSTTACCAAVRPERSAATPGGGGDGSAGGAPRQPASSRAASRTAARSRARQATRPLASLAMTSSQRSRTDSGPGSGVSARSNARRAAAKTPSAEAVCATCQRHRTARRGQSVGQGAHATTSDTRQGPRPCNPPGRGSTQRRCGSPLRVGATMPMLARRRGACGPTLAPADEIAVEDRLRRPPSWTATERQGSGREHR